MPTKDINSQLESIRSEIINRTLVIASIALGITALFSILRVFYLGWQYIFLFHGGLVVLLLLVTLLRHLISSDLKIYFLVFFFILIGIIGLFNFGLAGVYYFAFLAIAFLSVMQDRRIVILFSAMIVFSFLIIAVGYMTHSFKVTTDLNTYMYNPFTWILLIIITLSIIAIFIGGYSQFYQDLIRLLWEKKNIGEKLLKSRVQLQDLSDNLPNGYVYQLLFDTLTEERKFTFLSAGVKEVHGIEPDEAIVNASLLYDQILEQDRKVVHAKEKRAIEELITFREVVRFRVKDGSLKYILLTSAPQKERDGTVLFNGIGLDITEQKRAELEFEENEIKYRTLFNNANDAIFLMENDVFVDCNSKTLEMFGCKREEIIGQTPYLFSPAYQYNGQPSREQALGKIHAALTGESQFFEWQHNKINKELFDAEVSLNAIWFSEKQYIMAIVRDITERKKAERNIVESEQKLRNIYDNTRDALFIIDRQFKILTANLAFLKLMEIGPEQLFSINLFDHLLNENPRKLVQERLDLLYNGALNTAEFLIRNAKDHIFPVEARGALIEYESSQAILVSFNDISERKQLEKEVYIAGIQAEEQERSRLAKELHDGLGPLLSAAKLYLHTIKQKAGDKQNVIKLEELINESLAGIKDISNNISPHILRNFGLMQALNSFIEKIHSKTKIRINCRCDYENRFDEILELTVYRVLTELINNTLKYSEASYANISIEKTDRSLRIDYHDNGKGFNYASILKKNRGFGLMNIQSRILAIGGQYSYETEPGKGVFVKMVLPLN